VVACPGHPPAKYLARVGETMEGPDNPSKDMPFQEFERIDALRTDYLRELSGLSKVFITIASATLALTLAPFARDLLAGVCLMWLVATWLGLAATVALGLTQIFFFSSSFNARAKYLFASHLVDVVVRYEPGDKLEEFMAKVDASKQKYEQQCKWCVRLIVAQSFALLIAYVCLAVFMWISLKVRIT